MGQLLHLFESPNRFGLPAFYTLHVWAWKENPNGAFVNWQGTSGIVTKLAVQLWPKPSHSKRLFVFVGDLAGCFALVRELSHASLCSDLSAITWPLGKMVFGVDNPRSRDPGEPEIFVYLDVGAGDEAGLRYKERAVRRIVSRHDRSGLDVQATLSIDELIEVTPSLGRFAEAQAAFARAVETSPSPRILHEWALAAAEAGDDQTAQSAYRRNLEKDPTSVLGWQGLAAASMRLRDVSEAKRAATELVRHDPENEIGQAILAEIARQEALAPAPPR